jgi:AGCS family alanine or glycine:cation symporter
MALCTGIVPSKSLNGASFVQASLANVFGSIGPYFITFALLLFAFTTLLGNLYYCNGALNYIAGRTVSKTGKTIFNVIAILIVFIGAQLDFGLIWDTADVLMGFMAIVNLPVIVILGGTALKALKDYTDQRAQGKDPVFKAASIGLREKTDFWN